MKIMNLRNTEDPYSIQLNGGTSIVPPWPTQLANETMFLIPKPLNKDDEITVSGSRVSDAQRLTVSLITGYSSPDYQNIACQLDAVFSPNSEGKIEIKILQNGYQEVQHESNIEDYFEVSGTEFYIRFKVRSDSQLDIYASDSTENSSFLNQIRLKHPAKDIRFMTVSGDIEKVEELNFKFGY